MRSSTVPHFPYQHLSSPQPAFKVEDTIQPTFTELHFSSPTSLQPSAALEGSKGDSEFQPKIQADLLFRDGIRAGDAHNSCMDAYDKGSKTLDAPNTLPVGLEETMLDEDFMETSQPRQTTNDTYLFTMDELQADSPYVDVSLDSPPLRDHKQDFGESPLNGYDTNCLAGSFRNQSTHQNPTPHDYETSARQNGSEQNGGCSEMSTACKRLSVEVGPERLPPKRLKTDQSSKSPSTGTADDRFGDSSIHFGATNTVPINSATLSPDEGHQRANSTSQCAQRANSGTSDQGALRVRRSCSLNLRSAQIHSVSADENGVKQKLRRSVRQKPQVAVELDGQDGIPTKPTPLNSGKRPAQRIKPRKPRGRPAKKTLIAKATPREDEYNFTSLHSHFLSTPFDMRLQFVSWLFEAVLPRCMHESKATTNSPPELYDAGDEEEWEVEEVVGSRIFRGRLQYQVLHTRCETFTPHFHINPGPQNVWRNGTSVIHERAGHAARASHAF
ncbi:uncharacterized protein BO80DRAFT_498118 [Aspergillus ibericus CBS 121593]|uniref:Uncharacterized protein n=1 Tax=Aspergillus ibericus CBS 121593 TaxID=1448316 RepID=A0A395GIU9_9EURO|nr:hypothetical protein BO80DRAFT_498118 [Aspergillus ibericus CBS 121593]RAK94958.1 hypothetical protein BO80DRAFT_498118 [Aspergillus ibericus CBS 121593]